MAANYKVNIELDTKKLDAQLKDLGVKVDAVGKVKGKRSKQALNDSKKEVAFTRKNVLETKKELAIETKITKEKAKQLRLSSSINRTKSSNRIRFGGDYSSISDGKTYDASGGRASYLNYGKRGTAKFNRGAALSSATISGAFPLLFGQGPVSALGGAIGGGLGGGLGGQMGGFAGGLAGTTIATGISQLAGSIANLGKSFNSITPDVDALTGALGIAGTEEERRIKLIQKQQGVQAALSAVTDELNKAIGEKGVENLKRFGETSRLLGNEFTLLMTRMQAALAPLFELLATPFSGPARAREQDRLASIAGVETDPTMVGLKEQLAASEAIKGGGRSGAKSRERIQTNLKKRIEEREKELALLGKGIERSNNLRMIESDLTLKTRQKNELLQARIDGNYEEVKLAQDVNAEVQKRLEAGFGIMEINRKEIEDQIVKTNELTKQAEIVEKIEESYKKMAETIITDMGEGIKGLIKGTSTLNDVLNNVLDKMIDAFLNMAIYGNMSGTFTRGGGGLLGSIFKASGGPVKGGSPYIVGEKGPELFVPNSHGNIVPNNEMGGGSNIVVNVDASGSSVQGDGGQAEELGTMLAAAVQAELVNQQRPGGLLAGTR